MLGSFSMSTSIDGRQDIGQFNEVLKCLISRIYFWYVGGTALRFKTRPYPPRPHRVPIHNTHIASPFTATPTSTYRSTLTSFQATPIRPRTYPLLIEDVLIPLHPHV